MQGWNSQDIKHTNTLMLSKAAFGQNVVKVVDFGLACQFTPGEALRQCAGTAIYVAPQAVLACFRHVLTTSSQVLECRYDHRVDLWSCGVRHRASLSAHGSQRGDKGIGCKSVKVKNLDEYDEFR